jgi:hypothetical protein
VSTETAETAWTAPEGDAELIVPEPELTEVGGIEVTIRHLKTREFLQVMGIITRGLGPAAAQLQTENATPEEMGALMAAALMQSLPASPEEFIRLLKMIVEPVDQNRRVELMTYLNNPEIEDLLPIIDKVIENEVDNFVTLVGKARAYMARWKKMYSGRRSVLSPEPST